MSPGEHTVISESSRHVRGEAPVDGPASHPLMYVHRSFAISPRHVASLEKRDLVMDNGLVIEIPTKRLSQVKKELFG